MSVDTRDAGDWTPLHWSVEYQEFDCAKLLLAQGAGVNAADSHGIAALHIAAYKGWVQY